MNVVNRIHFLVTLSILVFGALSSQSQGVKLGLVKNEQPIKEAITVIYSNVPPLTGKQFYTVFIFGSGGGSYHDSKPLQFLPSGSVTLSPIQKPGAFDIVLYKYEDFSDSKPRQVARIPFKTVVPRSENASSNVPPKASPTAQEVTKKTTGSSTSVKPESKKAAEIKVPQGPAPKTGSGAVATTPSTPFKSSGAYTLLPSSKFNVEEDIVINYSLPPLEGNQYYSISVSRPADTYVVNISPEFVAPSGTLTLKPIYQAGIYELRVFRGNKATNQKEEIVYRQPLTIGTITKDFTGRYKCSTDQPRIFGTPAPGAPSISQVVEKITSEVAAKNLEVWLTPDDICLEFFSVQYLSKSNVKVPGQRGSVSYQSFPVKVRYKLVVNDFARQKAVITENGPENILHFYRPNSRTWNFHEVKAN